MRVAIAEDDALLCAGLVLLLGNEGIDVVAAVDNAEDFLTALDEHRPDAAVVDVRLPPSDTRHRRVLAVLAYLRS